MIMALPGPGAELSVGYGGGGCQQRIQEYRIVLCIDISIIVEWPSGVSTFTSFFLGNGTACLLHWSGILAPIR